MAIRRFINSTGTFDERATQILSVAFEEALRTAKIEDRSSPDAETLATRIIAIFEAGEQDPALIVRIATQKTSAAPLRA